MHSLLDEISESRAPIMISGNRYAVVLIGEDDWRAIKETLYLLSIPRMQRSVRAGMKTPVKKCFEELAG